MKKNNYSNKSKIYLDLSFFIILGIGLIVLIGPLLNGLFFETEMIFAQIVLGLLFVLYWLDRYIKGLGVPKLTYLDMAFISLICVYFISIIFAVDKHGAYITALRYLSYYAMFILTYRNINTPQKKKLILNIMFAVGTCVSLLGLLAATQFVNVSGAYAAKRIGSVFQYCNTFAAFSCAIFFLGFSLWVEKEMLLGKVYYGMGLLFICVSIIGTQSRAAWLIFSLLLCIYFIMLYVQNNFFWKSIYYFMLLITAVAIASKGFLSKVYAGQAGHAVRYLIYGMIIVLVGLIIFRVLERLLLRFSFSNNIKSLMLMGGLIYFLVIGVVYVNYMSEAMPSLSDHLVATEVTKRIQSINNTNSSFTGRMDMYRWAWQILQDYPLLGTGGRGWDAVYHQYQDYLYWSTEVHSNPLQIGVETGFTGLMLYLVLLGFAIYSVIKNWQDSLQEEDGHLFVGIILAIIMFFLHGMVDFDFTFGIISLYFFSLLAMIVKKDGLPGARLLEFNSEKTSILALTGLSFLSMFLLPALEYKSIRLGARAAVSMTNIQFDQAIGEYKQALRISPFNNKFASDLAQLYAAEFAITGQEDFEKEARYYATKTLQLAPNDLKVSQALLKTYELLGDSKADLLEQERIANILPRDRQTNLNIVSLHFKTGVDAIYNENLSKAKENLVKADDFLTEFLTAAEALSAKKYTSQPLPEHYLIKGQIEFIKGKDLTAEKYLQKAVLSQKTKNSAMAWLSALEYIQGEKEKADKSILDFYAKIQL